MFQTTNQFMIKLGPSKTTYQNDWRHMSFAPRMFRRPGSKLIRFGLPSGRWLHLKRAPVVFFLEWSGCSRQTDHKIQHWLVAM